MNKQRIQCAGHAGTLTAVAAAVGIGLAAQAAMANDPVNGVASGKPFVASGAPRVQPANTTVTAARVVVPDGSSVTQVVSNNPETHWFVIPVEQAKNYVLEVVNAEGDLGANAIQFVNLYNSDGTTTPPTEVRFDCTQSSVAPSVEVQPNADGARCTIRTFLPGPTATVGKRGVYARVDTNFGPSYQVRVRESTIYGRWTTTGYNFHTEVQNTTGDQLCVQVVYLPGTGSTPPTAPSLPVITQLTVPPHGAIKTVLNAGMTSGGDTKGDLRILGCTTSLADPQNFVPGSIHVSTYAFNPANSQYLYFFPWSANNGATGNSW